MNLTYEIIENGNGYLISKDGVPWIQQTRNDYIPHPADTMEESAQAHIDEILENANVPRPETELDRILRENEEMKAQILELQLALAEIGGISNG